MPVINENVLSLSQSTDLDFVLPSILKFNLDITAIFTMSDELLAKTLFHLNAANRSIPDQLSIISISDGEFPYLAYPQTSHVRDSGKKMGKFASKLLISILENGITPESEYLLSTKTIRLDSVKSISI
ncbi:MAG: substrate-binding domain-containing protein [Flavobacteriales bacterium]